MVIRAISVLFVLITVLVVGAVAIGMWGVDTYVAAYMGVCNTWQEGTCVVDMHRGHIIQYADWAAVNSDWLAHAPQAVFTNAGSGDIYRYDNGQHIQLTNHPERNTLPTWSPDGEHIAYTRVHRANDIDLYVMNPDGSSSRPMQTDLVSLGSAPVWSPDGVHLAYFTQLIDDTTQIWRLNIHGDEPFPLGTTIGSDASWSPDGKQLVFTGSRGYTQIIVDTTTGETLLERDTATRPDVAFWVSWSPDGAHIAYIYQQRNRVGRLEFIEVYNVATSETSRLLRKPYTMFSKPQWADNQHILQPVFDGAGSPHWNTILLINVKSGRIRRVPVLELQQFIGAVQW